MVTEICYKIFTYKQIHEQGSREGYANEYRKVSGKHVPADR
jgi:hypothetical protein